MPAQNTVISESVEKTLQIAESIAKHFSNDLVLLTGSLGAGKTAFARGFAKGIGINANVTSPSYTLMNLYKTDDKTLLHLDLYRVNCLEEIIDIGLYEYLDSGVPCLIEWSEKLPELSSLKHLNVKIEKMSDENARTISWQHFNARRQE